VLVADCLPIVLYALDTPVIALVHAGRMGTYHRWSSILLRTIATPLATPPAQLHAVLGPAIGACCYTLDRRAVGPFRTSSQLGSSSSSPRPGALDDGPAHSQHTATTSRWRPREHIETASICTACHQHDLYSHRAEGQEAGRGMAMVALNVSCRASQ